MQPQPPPGYQPGGWQQPNTYQPPQLQQQQPRPRTQTFNMEVNVASGLCYLPFFFIHFILPIIFISSEPKSNRFVRFHAFQALFMAITGIVGGIGCYILFVVGFLLTAVIAGATQSPAAAVFGVILFGLFILGLVGFGLFMLISTIVACIKAFNGQVWKVPVIGKLAERYA